MVIDLFETMPFMSFDHEFPILSDCEGWIFIFYTTCRASFAFYHQPPYVAVQGITQGARTVYDVDGDEIVNCEDMKLVSVSLVSVL
jgi:hypothetical protein